MSREYKFSGITEDAREVRGNLAMIGSEFSVLVDGARNPHKVYSWTVAQWTGFIDKNGEEIYEDNDVEYRHQPCKIKYNEFAGKCYIYAGDEVVQPLNAKTAADCEVKKYF